MSITRHQLTFVTILVGLSALLFAAVHYSLNWRTRAMLLQQDPARLERLGRRLIVGYKDFAEIKNLVAHRAVAGVYVTTRNVGGRSVSDIARDIAQLQDIRAKQGLPKLIIAADQEGGLVSHLSPPLNDQPSLAEIIAPMNTDDERRAAVSRFAETQAHGLNAIGITMNLAPVVDLRPTSTLPNDELSRIYERAIASDPQLVAQVATWYCHELWKFDIACVLKHFPGLGRVTNDTHVAAGEIRTDEEQLERSDWIPFRQGLKSPGAALMVGHVRLDAVDRARPASYSPLVVTGLLRQKWRYDGLAITDDLGMGAITESVDGIGTAAVQALNAGIDLLLIAKAKKNFDAVLSALIDADATGKIDRSQEAASLRRLSAWSQAFSARH
ncbi:MAG: glycoside hydrolase family 3 N-terminal domain-containing protein [Hyphomicrobium sp.]